MIDKFKTCQNCPDRCIEPNCHNTCEGYLARKKRFEKISEERRDRRIISNLAFTPNCFSPGKRLTVRQWRNYHSEENLERSRQS